MPFYMSLHVMFASKTMSEYKAKGCETHNAEDQVTEDTKHPLQVSIIRR